MHPIITSTAISSFVEDIVTIGIADSARSKEIILV